MTTTAAIESPRAGPTGVPDTLTRILNFDLTRPLAFALLAAAYLASRAPFINTGYGTDPDAWRVAISGYWLWDHQEFYPSRLPGYPVHELASALVIQGGWLATNALTVLVSLLGLWFFGRLVQLLDVPNKAVAVIAFAFTPLIWINSMTTMDYMWSLSFVLGSYYFLTQEQSSRAGFMLGLAAGCRLPSLAMLLPFVVLLWRDDRREEIRDFLTWTIFVPVVAYSPIAWKYGFNFLNFYDARVGYLNVLRLLGKDTLGLLGSVAVLGAIAISLPRLARLPQDVLRDKHVMVWFLAVVVGIVTFLRLPHEAAYLLPVYPFGFLLMAKYFQRWVLAGAIAVIILAGFVDLTSPGDEITTEAFTSAELGKGLILSNQETQELQRTFVRDIAAQEIPNRSVVSLGFIYPQFVIRNRDRLEPGILEGDKSSISQLSDKGKARNAESDITYVWLLDWDGFEKYRSQGYTLFHTLDSGRSTAGLYDYRPALLGSVSIDLGRGPSGGSGAARTDR
ncbi:MAG TPA: hypothetical protein VJP07_03110 [Dehalococcoidia bacterium]|nr:hypothetical protein [Dehalococcoidia bacterium]